MCQRFVGLAAISLNCVTAVLGTCQLVVGLGSVYEAISLLTSSFSCHRYLFSSGGISYYWTAFGVTFMH